MLDAVMRDGLSVVFQPIVELESGRPFGYEALGRVDRRIANAGTPPKARQAVILAALSEHERTRVRLIGAGRYDASDRLERIEEVEDLVGHHQHLAVTR